MAGRGDPAAAGAAPAGRSRRRDPVSGGSDPRTADRRPGSGGRLVTLSGPGGSGKTRLAVAVAARLVEPLQGAVWFVRLVNLSDPKLFVNAVPDGLRLPRSSGVEPLEQVVGALTERHPSALMVKDS